MKRPPVSAALLLFVSLPVFGVSKREVRNWTAPPFWTPQSSPEAVGASLWEPLATQALPSAPLPFVAITPCRLADTRAGQGFTGLFGPPRLSANTARTFPIAGNCGIAAGARAVSANVTVVVPSAGPGYLAFYPSGTTWPGSSNINFMAGDVIANTAIVPLGADGGMSVIGNVATDLIIDVNGYYAEASLVSSLNGLTGDVVLAQGSNVTITPSGSTLTIAASGGGGGSLPPGTSGQTLRHDGSGWVASSVLTNDGTNVAVSGGLGVGGGLNLTAGRIDVGPETFVHRGGDPSNIFVGLTSGTVSSTGQYNAALGRGALGSLTSGDSNVAIGCEAGSKIASARKNVAVGTDALGRNTNASNNVAVGDLALWAQDFGNSGQAYDSDNTAVGYWALVNNAPTAVGNGIQNSVLGAYAMKSNTTGSFNVAIGHGALYSTTSAERNVAVGRGALYSSNGGHDNVAVGDYASSYATTGSWNVAIGQGALLTNQTGSRNVAIGYQAGANETNSDRLYIGNGVGTLIYGEFDNGRVGIGATNPGVALDVNGQIKSRTISSASASTSVCFSATGVLGTCTSDLRLKKNVTPLAEEMDVLGALSCLRGVSYEWDTSQERARDLGPGREIGLVAQEVETVLPQVVSTAPDGYKSLDYARISAFLVDVARAQQKEIAALRDLVVRQDARIRSLEVSRESRPE